MDTVIILFSSNNACQNFKIRKAITPSIIVSKIGHHQTPRSQHIHGIITVGSNTNLKMDQYWSNAWSKRKFWPSANPSLWLTEYKCKINITTITTNSVEVIQLSKSSLWSLICHCKQFHHHMHHCAYHNHHTKIAIIIMNKKWKFWPSANPSLSLTEYKCKINITTITTNSVEVIQLSKSSLWSLICHCKQFHHHMHHCTSQSPHKDCNHHHLCLHYSCVI